MKYAYLKLSLSLILAILFISCNKDDINNSSQINIEKNKYSSSLFSIDPNGYLIFNTPESYENALSYLKSLTDSQLDSLELSLNFISSYSYFNDKTADTLKTNIGNVVNHNKSLDDELLHRIINKNGMIQIDGTIFKLVSDSMLVYSMKSSYKNTQYSNFLSGSYNYSYTNQLNNESIPEEYNTVFEFVRSNPSGIKVTSQKPFKETPGGVTTPVGDPSGPTFRARTDIAYIKAVFYYSLIGKLHYEKKYGALWLAYNTNMKVS